MKPLAIITGGTRGIGLGIARALAGEGCHLALCGRRPVEEVGDVLDELRATGVEVHYAVCNLASSLQRERFLSEVLAKLGVPTVLVNNAGMAPRVRADLLDASEDVFEEVLQVNLQGPYFLTQQVARLMVQERSAHPERVYAIVNIGSVSATLASVHRGEYCISKAGVAMATTLWAVRLAEHDIPVYEVRPGVTETDMTAGVKDKYDELIAEGLVPQRRWGQPADTGRVVAALVRGDLAYSTGQVIMVDGGLTLPRL